MDDGLVRAYLDDYREIEVIIDKKFCEGKSNAFYLMDGKQSFPLELISSKEHITYYSYKLKYSGDIDVGTEYQIMVANAFKCVLQYRFIVKTERFDQQFGYDGDDLGSTLTDKYTKFALWAPTASRVKIEIEYGDKRKTVDMHRTEKGVFRLTIAPRCIGAVYRYLVRVNGQWHQVNDPYGKASLANSERSVVVDPESYRVERLHLPELWRYSDAVIYETSVRDYSKEGTFRGMISRLPYLKDLGITSLQLMPVNDFGSVDENNPELFYNWGYDPVQYFALEGSYSSNVSEPLQILTDFRDLVLEAHRQCIRINLDVVFNHVYYLKTSIFNQTVPYYFFRYDSEGRLCDGTYCGNDVDSGKYMVRKYIIDVLKYFVSQFDVDGFRFDLMGILDVETMNQAYEALRALKSDIMLYGEGWKMNTALKDEEMACSSNSSLMKQIAFFNDSFRDTIKGSTFDAALKGYATGKKNLTEEACDLMKGATYSRAEQSVNYVECHDDMTVYDKLAVCCREEDEDRINDRVKLLLGMVILAQGIPFIHSGQEFCRSKYGMSNTYNQPDSVNKLKEEDKEKHRDIISHVKTLINIRRKYRINKNADHIETDVETEAVRGVIIYKVASCSGNTDLTIIINPTDKTFDYRFDGYQKLLFDGQRNPGIVGSIVCVRPVSITILGSNIDD